MARSTKRSKSKKVNNYRKVSQRQDSVIERRLDRDDKLLDDPKNKAILSRGDDDLEEAVEVPPKNNASSTDPSPGYIDPSSILSPELQEAMGVDADAVMVSSRSNKQKKNKKREVRSARSASDYNPNIDGEALLTLSIVCLAPRCARRCCFLTLADRAIPRGAAQGEEGVEAHEAQAAAARGQEGEEGGEGRRLRHLGS
jgi:hypothetical protein